MSRYIVEKEIQEAPCEHPDCERFHQRFMETNHDGIRFHMTKRVEWLVIDTETGNQVSNASTKKHCVWEANRLNRLNNQ